MAEKKYNADSITSLKGPDRVRKRPAVIFGTNDERGCFHAIFEIIANSIDEAREGHCDRIEVKVRDNMSVEVSDNGRGVPMDWNEKEQQYAWQLVFNELYAGGKMDEDAYASALGLNGLGAASCQYASSWFHVTSRDGTTEYEMHFEKGFPVGELKKRPCDLPSGTIISFLPDPEVFTDINISAMVYVEAMRQQAIQIPGLTMYFECPEVPGGVTISYPQGAKGYLDDLYDKQMLPNGAYSFETSGECDNQDGKGPYQVKMRLAMTFTRDNPVVEAYHNGSPLTNGGTSVAGLQAGILTAVESLARSSNKLTKSDKLLWKDVAEIMAAVLETYSPGGRSMWMHQTKTAINNKSIGTMVAQSVCDMFIRWAGDNKSQADKVINEILLNKKARESAESVKKKIIKKLSTSVDGRGGEKPKKFVDCQERDSSKRELYIVEGDSAAGACMLSRDSGFQALMPVRGKIINCLKEPLPRILNSDIIVDLYRIFGCGMEVKSKHITDLPKFDINKLRYSKVIICTDADIDGMQIRCLIITMIYRLSPSLLREGKVFIAETPLYEITYGDGKDAAFAYTDEERDEILEQWKAKGYRMNNVEIARSKGLGENNPEMMAVSTMNPNTRRLLPVEMDEITEDTISVFEALLGNDLESRKYIIQQYLASFDSAE